MMQVIEIIKVYYSTCLSVQILQHTLTIFQKVIMKLHIKIYLSHTYSKWVEKKTLLV